MNKKKLIKKINIALEDFTPNIKNRILTDCREMKQEENEICIKKDIKGKRFVKRFVCTFAALIALLTVFVAIMVKEANTEYDIIYLDVNPSFSFTVNSKGKVINAKANNIDAHNITIGTEFDGKDINSAISDIVGEMIKQGYITSSSNSVLISGENDGDLLNELSDKTSAQIKKYGFEGAVLTQIVKKNDDTVRIAEKYGVSLGKAQLVKEITENTENGSVGELAKMNINDLNLIASQNYDILTDVLVKGKASEGKYIGREEAAYIIVSSVNESEISCKSENFVDVQYKADNGKIVYYATTADGRICYVDAVSGEMYIIKDVRKSSDEVTYETK